MTEEWGQDVSLLQSAHIPLNLSLAALGIVGWNRQRCNHLAGPRTMMLVSLGSAAFALTGAAVLLKDAEGRNFADPTRVIAGIVGGIGFLGAGTIIRAGREVKGVTTAAAIWVTAAIGASFGLSQYLMGASTVILTALILWLSPVEAAVFGRDHNQPVGDAGSGRRDGDALV